MSTSLGIISIILIIAITLLVLYRKNKDNTEYFIPTSPPSRKLLEDNIINNNNKLNNTMKQLLSSISNPTINFSIDPAINNNEFQKSVGKSIETQSLLLKNSYLSNNSNTSASIDELENTLIDLENIINNKKMKNINKNKYNVVKSLNNGMEMNLISTPNTIFQDNTTGKITDSYLVNVNNGCLSVGANNYDVYKCNDKNPKQMFKMQHIINETDYGNNIDKSLPFDNVDKTTINYPFAMIKSVNNDECLTNNHGTLTVQPCYSFVAQRWMPL